MSAYYGHNPDVNTLLNEVERLEAERDELRDRVADLERETKKQHAAMGGYRAMAQNFQDERDEARAELKRLQEQQP